MRPQNRPAVMHLPRRQVCGALVLLGLGASTGLRAQNSSNPRPALERFIQTAQLLARSRLWAKDFAKIAKSPNHPLYAPASQILAANDSELLGVLVRTFKDLSEEDAHALAVLLETAQGQWIVQSSLWAQEFVLSRAAERNLDPSRGSDSRPRKLSNLEIRDIKAIGDTLPWQALRRAGNASLLGSELLMALDFPQFVDLMLDPSQR